MTWTDDDLVRAILTRPVTADRLEKARKRATPEQWLRVLPRVQPPDSQPEA